MKKSPKSSTKASLQKRIDELENQNKQLKKQLSSKGDGSLNNKTGWFKNLISVFLLFIAASMFVSSINFSWLQSTLFETDEWVNTNTEIISNETVARDISSSLTEILYEQVDAEELVSDVLPQRARILAAPIASSIENFISERVNELVSSDQFISLWGEINRTAHSSLINSIENYNQLEDNTESRGLVYIQDDFLILNVRPLLDEAKSTLVENGLSFLPEDNVIPEAKTTFVIAKFENFQTILGVFNLTNSMSYWLPVLGAVFALAGVYISTNRRRAIVIGSIIAIFLALGQIQLVKAGQHGLSQIIQDSSSGLSVESTIVIYKALTDDLVSNLRLFIGGLALVMLFIYLTGASKFAAKLRNQLAKLFKNKKDNKQLQWVATNANVIITIATALIVSAIILLPLGSPWAAIWMLVLNGLVAIIVLAIKQDSSNK